MIQSADILWRKHQIILLQILLPGLHRNPKTKEKTRIRYAAYLGCNNEKLENVNEAYDYYYDEIEYKAASISDMQKSSLSEILDYELRWEYERLWIQG